MVSLSTRDLSECLPFRETLNFVMPSKGKGRANRQDLNVYAHALPLVPVPSTTLFARSLRLVRLHVVSIENPRCVGIFDEPSRSVWIVNARDRDILWRRGFFGKGNLSRSEPSWLNRKLNQLDGGETTKGELNVPFSLMFLRRSFFFTYRALILLVLTAEEITALRRAEREHFKSERERAINEAAAKAEEVFRAEGKLPEAPAEHISTAVRTKIAAERRNATVVEKGSDGEPPQSERPSSVKDTDVEVEDMEHLQLTLEEAFFLSWALGCLEILHSSTVR